MDEDRKQSLIRTLEAGRIPSTITEEDRKFVRQWLLEHGHVDAAREV